MTEQEIAKRIRSGVAAVDRKYRRLIALKVAELERAEGEGLKAKRTELEALRLEAKREHQRAYWNNRARQYEAAWTQRSKETIERDLKKAYEAGLKEIEESIMKLYNTFAKDNEVSIVKAREILTSSEYRKWRMSLEEYVKNIEAGDKGLELELNTLAMRSRISRLDKLYSETLMELDKIGRESQQRLSLFLDEAYKENYTRYLFDLAKIGGIEIAASAVERINSEKVLASRWSGENFSSRIWSDKRKLSKVIKTTIESGIHQGLDVREMSKRINDVMTSGYKNAVRLIRTEMNFVNNQAAANSFDESGIVYYEFIAVLDNRTSKMCQSRDGEVYPMSEKSVGFNFPPLHPRCRSTVAPYIEGSGRLGSRIAKVNGKRLHVSETMTYSEFAEKYQIKQENQRSKAKISLKPGNISKPEPSMKHLTLSPGDYNLTVRRQVQNRHIEGTSEYPNYAEKLAEKGLKPSKLADNVDVAKLVKEFHGKGIYDPNPKDNSPREIVDTGRIIGQYWDNREFCYVYTTFIKIVYSKKGVHIYPIRG